MLKQNTKIIPLVTNTMFKEAFGKEEGIKQTQKQVVINMLNDNLDIDIISKYTDLSIEEISEIKESLN